MPVIALVGRPNVGKSTLFNCLTRSRNALVANQSGLTRDRQHGVGRIGEIPFTVIDAGGLTDKADGIENLMAHQVWQAVAEADIIFFMVDGRVAVNLADEKIADDLRKIGKKILLVANKAEGANPHDFALDYFKLGFGKPLLVSAAHNQRITTLVTTALGEATATVPLVSDDEKDDAIYLTVIGRPNAGKSTFLNYLIGEERLLTYDMPGTTRDSIAIPCHIGGQKFVLIDTAGVRRRSKITDVVEKFSVNKTIKTLDRAHIALLMIDATQGFSKQDAGLLSSIISSGRAFILAINKWDLLSNYEKQQVEYELKRQLHFVKNPQVFFICAKNGLGIKKMMKTVRQVFSIAHKRLSTSQLNQALQEATTQNPPPLVRGHRIKLKHIHQGGHNPPLLVIHGNKTADIPKSYESYLKNFFQNAFGLHGTPISIVFKSSINPYEGRKNILTQRQVNKKKRLRKFVGKR